MDLSRAHVRSSGWLGRWVIWQCSTSWFFTILQRATSWFFPIWRCSTSCFYFPDLAMFDIVIFFRFGGARHRDFYDFGNVRHRDFSRFGGVRHRVFIFLIWQCSASWFFSRFGGARHRDFSRFWQCSTSWFTLKCPKRIESRQGTHSKMQKSISAFSSAFLDAIQSV